METETYKCPNCGGGLLFDPQTQKFHCEYCMSYFNEEELSKAQPEASSERPPEKAFKEETGGKETTGSEEEAGAVLYTCPSCGAEIVTEETTAATFCYYCHNPVVLSGRLEGKWKPDAVIPFAFNREEAVSRFRQWIGKKKFVPRGFFSEKQIEKLTGVYFPYWRADSTAQGSLTAQGVKIRTWRAGDIEYTERSYYRVLREGRVDLEDMTFSALSRGDRSLAEGVQPFDDSAMEAFRPLYLQGFQAEKRDMEKDQFRQRMEGMTADYTKRFLMDTINGYQSLSPSPVQLHGLESKWQYALLPVWVLTYRDKKGKLFYYTMNGQTGKACGKLPVDIKRLLALFLGIFLPLLILLLIGGYLL